MTGVVAVEQEGRLVRSILRQTIPHELAKLGNDVSRLLALAWQKKLNAPDVVVRVEANGG